MNKNTQWSSRAFRAGLVFILLALPIGAFGQELKLGLSVSVPEGNWFLYDTDEGYRGRFGFLGLAVEFRYYYLRDAYLALNLGTLLDFFLPFPAAYDPPRAFIRDDSGRNELFWGLFLSIKNGYRSDFGLCVDYGLAVARVYHRVTTWEKGKVSEEKSSESAWFTVGPAGGVEYVWSFNLITALRYLPGLIRMDGRGVKLEYGHLLFFDIGYLFGS